MKRYLALALIALTLAASRTKAQTITPVVYSLPDTGTSAQWVALGTYTASQGGYDINIQIVSSNGFNAVTSQDQTTYIQFKTSNDSSTNSNGFAGDAWWYQTGPNVSAPSQVVWVGNAAGTSATAFTLYAYFGIWNGAGSYYVVDVPSGASWTNSATALGSSNPPGVSSGSTTGSSTVLFAQNQYVLGSPASFAGGIIQSPSFYTYSNPGSMNGAIGSDLYFQGLQTGNGSGDLPWGLNIANPPWTWGGDPMTFHAGQYTWQLNSNGSGAETTALTIDRSGNLHPKSVIYGDNTQQTTAWTGVLCGGDYAEDMRADQKKEIYEPGDVLILTSDDTSDVRKSAEPYSTMVAGIYATKPGVVGMRDAVSKSNDNLPMAMVGVVPTKVSAENGPIHKGDLLVTASLRGYAMKGTDRSKMLGAVLGKAMGSLDSGTGVIEVLVTLQ